MDISYKIPKYSGAEMVVTLAQAKDHLRIDQAVTNEDDEITIFIKAAMAEMEGFIRGPVLRRSNVIFGLEAWALRVNMPTGPIASINSVKYLKSGGVKYTTLDPGNSAAGTFTPDPVTNLADGDTVTIGSKTYKFQATLTDVDGNIQIGAAQGDTLNNFAAALDLSGTPGTDYATLMTVNTDVTGIASVGALVATSKISGIPGNEIATTETSAVASWGDGFLTGGTPSNYTLFNYADTAHQIIFKEAALSIALEDERGDVVRISTELGWMAADLPDDITAAAFLLIGDLYEFRSDRQKKPINSSSRILLRPYRWQ